MKRINLIFAALFLAGIFLLSACKSKGPEKEKKFNPEFANYISAFTSGVVSAQDPVSIKFTQKIELSEYNPGDIVEMDLFSFSPKLKGEIYLEDEYTIRYEAFEPMVSGQEYEVEFALDKLFKVEKDLRKFEFGFKVISQAFNVVTNGFSPYDIKDPKNYFLEGVISTADYMNESDVRKLIKAEQDNRSLSISWNLNDNPRRFSFVIDSINRKEDESSVILNWDGNLLNLEEKGSISIPVPVLGKFEVADVSIVQQPEQYVLIRFSDALKEEQQLKGIIHFEGMDDLSFSIESNTIKVFPGSRMFGLHTLKIESGVRNFAAYRMKEQFVKEISFEDIKPGVRLMGNGVIIPNSEGLIFPFEAVNLNAVDITIIEIYQDNIQQFLQRNRLNGDYELKRVGRPILRKKISLKENSSLDVGTWNAYFIDLAELIEDNAGSIYQVELSFRKSYSLFVCEKGTDDEAELQEVEEDKFDDSYWDNSYYYSYHYYRPRGFEWREVDNPCHISYYNSDRWVSRNVLASNLGIIAKEGNNNKLKVAVTDLLSASPLANVRVELYNFQQQLLEASITDANGFSEFELSKKPYLLIAKNGEDKGYLRLDDGSSLSLSMFDVSGNVVQEGIKGFLYGERGVWRPGDTLFINFILEDENNVLPENHPVSFELKNPQGQLIKRIVKTSGINGFYNFTTLTDPESQTGMWNATVIVGGSRFYKNIRIETVKPNRLKLKLDYDSEILSADNTRDGKLSVKWLHGAIAGNLKANVMVTLNPVKTNFENYKGYVFDDKTKRYYPREKVIFDKRVDASGEASVKANLGLFKNAPGMLKADFMVRAFEEGGDFSTDYFSKTYAPYVKFVGMKIPESGSYGNEYITDSTYKVDIATVDKNGSPLDIDKLDVTIVKMRWRWWWDISSENIGNYVRSNYRDIISQQQIATKNGKGLFNLKIEYPNWGRYLVQVSDPLGGHSSSQIIYVDWPDWVSRDNRKQPEGAKVMTVTTDKDKYNVGDEAIVSFPSAGQGRALISIENGSGILDAYWVEPNSDQDESSISFKISEKMCPNIYVHITYIQPHGQTANDLPIRLYGVKSILVEDPLTRLYPVITMKDELAPEKEFVVEVSEKNNRKMTYTLAVVDDGLLDLTRFKTPDPWKDFYAKEALGVKTWDLFDHVLGAYGGKMEQLFATGGDEGELSKTEAKANRFKPVVMFLGPFELNGKSTSHKLRMPSYVGSVRTMVIAGNDGAYGHTQKTTPVKNPLMILGTLPRVLGPGETVKLPVTVFAMDEKVKNVKIKVQTNDLFEVKGVDEKLLQFNKLGDEVVNFELEVAEKTGIGKVKIVASSGNEKATYEIELDIRNPNPPLTEFYQAIIEPGDTWEMEYLPVGMEGTNEGLLEISNIPPIDFGKRLKYLINYPYGCSEQTTSAAFPQLYLEDVMELDQKEKDFTTRNVRYAIERLTRMQHSDGGFRYWPDAVSPNDWTSSYAGHFMLEAENRGYTLPTGFKKKWIKYQTRLAKNWVNYEANKPHYSSYSHLLQAYRLYTLALAGSPDLSSMNRFKEVKGLRQLAKWRLAATYALAGKPEVARDIIKDLDFETKDNKSMNLSFGSSLRDKAMILETLIILKERDKAAPLVMELSEKLSNNYWYSTQTTAYCLIALAKFAGRSDLTGRELFFDFNIQNQEKGTKNTEKPLTQYQLDINTLENGLVSVTNKGKSIIYTRLMLEGIPVAGDEKAAESKLKIDVKYKTLAGKEMLPAEIEQGTDFIAEVVINNSMVYGDYQNMALSQIFPSGWEIINTRIAGYSLTQEVDRPQYRDIRDDRVYTHFWIGSKKRTYTLMLNAAYQGRFYLPAVSCEAMYDNTVYARVPGQWVEVVEPGTK